MRFFPAVDDGVFQTLISHWHDMGDWKPDRTVRLMGRPVYLWVIR
ncbi:MAG TPA: hypothetical protein VMK31_00370 [Sphingomicrobium sp.]|nr:hypothetical protein [Sphingomicrobium sp.]